MALIYSGNNELKELALMLSKRDNISVQEAWSLIETSQQEIRDAIDNCAGYDEIADILADNLGIEPDYLDIMIM